MINVTDLTCFVYCKRKFYIKHVLGFKQKPTKQMIAGRIRHQAQELMFKNELQTLKKLKSPDKNKIKDILKKNLKHAIEKTISASEKEIKHFQIDTNLIKKQFFLTYKKFIQNRTLIVIDLMQRKNLFGKALIDALYPRFMAEVSLSSKSFSLKGKVDLIEEHKDKIIPIELKTGLAPKNNIWPQDRIQLIAYALLAKENFEKPVSYAKIIYSGNQEIKLYLNSFMPYEIKSLISKIKGLLSSKNPPPRINSKKCLYCSFREHCEAI
ncbi:CRISPR-associated protein Cas4 [Candidatus Woesearchaeota archaeon]|nr:CRISPR-associated protein Cas4 [Candidatus Woesearchaeota archaeon]